MKLAYHVARYERDITDERNCLNTSAFRVHIVYCSSHAFASRHVYRKLQFFRTVSEQFAMKNPFKRSKEITQTPPTPSQLIDQSVRYRNLDPNHDEYINSIHRERQGRHTGYVPLREGFRNSRPCQLLIAAYQHGENEGRPLGYFCATVATTETDPSVRTLIIHDLVVASDYQNRGHGGELLREAERRAPWYSCSIVAFNGAWNCEHMENEWQRRSLERRGYGKVKREQDAPGSCTRWNFAKEL